MSLLEFPNQFTSRKKVGDIEIVYTDLMEISQGGPEVGNLSINGKLLDGRFSGPALCQGTYVFAPAQVNRFLGTGFKLVRINTTTLQVEYLGQPQVLIFLYRIEGNRVYFFEDMGQTQRNYYDL